MKADYRTCLSDRVITVFVGEFDRRFSGDVCEVLNSMSALFLQSEGLLNVITLQPFVEHYHIRHGLLKSECEVFAAQYARISPGCEIMLNVLRFIDPHRACYVQLHTAYQITCLQVSVCSQLCKYINDDIYKPKDAQDSVNEYYDLMSVIKFLLNVV